MTSPVVQTTSTGADASAVVSHTVTMPTGITVGDLLVALIENNNNVTVSATGWTSLGREVNGTTVALTFLYRTADGTEGASQTFTTSASAQQSYGVFRISGWSGTPERGTAATGTSTGPNPPSLSPSWGALDNLFLAAYGAATGTNATGFPTSYTAGPTNHSTGQSMGSASRQLTAASDDPSAFTIGSSVAWVAQTYAIKPAGTTYTLTSAVAAFTLTGIAAKAAYGLGAAVGAFVLTGVAATLSKAWKPLSAAVAAFTLTGNSVTILAGKVLVAAVGAFTLTGQTAWQKIVHVSQAASFALMGQSSWQVINHLSSGAAFVLTGKWTPLSWLRRGTPYLKRRIAQAALHSARVADPVLGKIRKAAAAISVHRVTDPALGKIRQAVSTLSKRRNSDPSLDR